MNEETAKIESFYHNLEKHLDKYHNFPNTYLYKFILPNRDSEKLGELYQVFDGLEYSVSTKESNAGKYVSVSISCFVLDSDQIIKIYKKVAKIKGIIML